MKNEFYDIVFRKKIYHTIEELQTDVDEWLVKYNEYRPHSGPRCYGKTPLQTFLDAKKIANELQLENRCESSDNTSEFLQQNASHTQNIKTSYLADKPTV